MNFLVKSALMLTLLSSSGYKQLPSTDMNGDGYKEKILYTFRQSHTIDVRKIKEEEHQLLEILIQDGKTGILQQFTLNDVITASVVIAKPIQQPKIDRPLLRNYGELIFILNEKRIETIGYAKDHYEHHIITYVLLPH